MRIILASGSPRRRELLDQIGTEYEVRPSEADESITSTIPSEVVKELALRKGREVAAHYEEDVVILSADTVVANEGKILGKPKDDVEAAEMINSIQGKSHEVYTGVAIIIKRGKVSGSIKGDVEKNKSDMEEPGKEKIINFAVETKVKVVPMTEEEIKGYLRTGEHRDKAGAYAIQGKFAPYIEGIEGDYYNVVGFPISRICKELSKEGINMIGY